MELALQAADGSGSGGTLELSDATFGADFNEGLVHQVVTAYMAASRSGTKAQKSRSDVRGGGAKPWRQKGTGRARVGSSRNPIWRGGGATFAARPRNYEQKVNKKMYRGAMRCILSELARSDRLIAVESFEVDQPKTKELAAKLGALGVDDVLVVTDSASDNLLLAARNLHWVAVVETAKINPVALVAFDKVIITKAALQAFEGQLS
jgi:large subunit ribosomal protein L4